MPIAIVMGIQTLVHCASIQMYNVTSYFSIYELSWFLNFSESNVTICRSNKRLKTYLYT